MSHHSKKSIVLLWIAQSLLAALFLFAGVMKFVMPVAAMQQGPVVFSATFLHFIGVCEVLGAFGLVLPGIFRIHQYLTPLAAAGLVVIMIGATVTSAVASVAGAAVPFVVGLIAFAIYRGRGGVSIVPSGRVDTRGPLATHF